MIEKRNFNYGIELLRIVSMLMIIYLHVIGQGGIRDDSSLFSMNYFFILFFETVCFVCVNCFAIISGYVYYHTRVKYKNIILLYLKVWIISVLIFICFYLFYKNEMLKYVTLSFMPLTQGSYWYFTAYTGLFFLLPLIQKGIENYDIEEGKNLIIILVIVFSGITTFFHTDVFKLDIGYSMIWLMILNIIGMLIHKLVESGNYFQKKSLYYFKRYVALLLVTYFLFVCLEMMSYNLINTTKGRYFFLDYTNIFIVISSVLLFLSFIKIETINNKFKKYILFFSKNSFDVYLLHTNPLIFSCLFPNLCIFSKLNTIELVFFLVVLISGIYISCMLIGKIVDYLIKKFYSYFLYKFF